MLYKVMMFAAVLFITLPVRAADFSWMDDKGAIHQLDEYRGKPVLLHLWASWCPPCRAEMPELAAWLKKNPEVTVIPVSLDNSLEDAQVFLDDNHFDLAAQLTDSSQAMAMGARGLPTTLVISANGEVKHGFIGARDWQDKSFTDGILSEFRKIE
ncbi:MAG: TlpA disulfide reductase family protein [Mariprofundaceae bacterium]